MTNIYDSKTYIQDINASILKIPNKYKLKNKSILITGATGLIGSFIVDLLMFANKNLFYDMEIFVLGRSIDGLKKRFENYLPIKNFHMIEQDIKKPLAFQCNTDFVIHAAGNAYPACFSSDPVGTILGTVLGTSNVLEFAMKNAVKRVVYISSGEVYGNLEKDNFSENIYGNLDHMKPRACYPLSKRTAENLCISYNEQYNLDVVIARLCHIYGPNVTISDNRATAQFMRCAIKGKNIVMKSDGKQYRSYCYIADCVSAIITILINGKSCEAYNVANKYSRSTIYEFAKKIAFFSNVDITVEHDNTIDKNQVSPFDHAVLESDKLENLGWTGLYDLDTGIEHTLKIMTEKL